MKYHIKAEDGVTLASFLHESDRDACIETLRELYSDYVFDSVNGE